MERIISYCGLRCDECKAREYTLADDNEGRIALAAEWSKMYNSEIKPEHINCLGCTVASNTRFPHWNTCEYRVCASKRGVANCAHCADYACDKLQEFFGWVPEAKALLDEIHASL